jgi:two-component system, CAI-1 autoinducer sensor kinase/phosphatase CqsS
MFRRFEAALRASTDASLRSMVVAGAVGAAVYTGYGILWLYVTPVEHESLALRCVAVLLCLAVCVSPRWPARARPLLPWVWFVGVMYALPFYATYQLLGSNYSVLRSMLEVTMVFFVIVIFPHYLLALANIVLGIGLGVLAGYLTIPHFASLNHAIVKAVHLQAMVYSVVAGLLVTRSNLKGLLGQQRSPRCRTSPAPSRMNCAIRWASCATGWRASAATCPGRRPTAATSRCRCGSWMRSTRS